MPVLNYVELPVASAGASAKFYGDAFGWRFTQYGPDYAAHEGGPCELGLDGTAGEKTAHILPVIEVENLEAARDAVLAAGGVISLDIFAFPGGRRFHFTDPDGLELAVYVKEG
jgi:predicted enzyme related to lactoylglutathione lyase